MSTAPAAGRLAAELAERERILRELIEAEAEAIAGACHAIARCFHRGGTLLPYGAGTTAVSDAAHAAVEFMHPIIVGKRALPALAPQEEADPLAAAAAGRPDDIALGLAHSARDAEELVDFIRAAREREMLTIAMSGADGFPGEADYTFRVPSDDPAVVQEVQETIYHVFWELVHTFFEHPGLLADSCITCGDVAVEVEVVETEGPNATVERGGARERIATELVGEVAAGDRLLAHAGVAIERVEHGATPGDTGADDPSGFLYPFLERTETDLDSVLADVRASTVRKGEDVIELRSTIDTATIAACADRIRGLLDAGGRLFAFGNGGSATDAQDLAIDLRLAGRPARCLTTDVATVTAVGNDVGFDKVFSRQLIALGREGDVAVAITTSGNSANVLNGLEEAHRRGLSCVAVAGYDGGRLAELDWLDELFVVESDYVPRIQEAQATIYHLLVEAIGGRR